MVWLQRLWTDVSHFHVEIRVGLKKAHLGSKWHTWAHRRSLLKKANWKINPMGAQKGSLGLKCAHWGSPRHLIGDNLMSAILLYMWKKETGIQNGNLTILSCDSQIPDSQSILRDQLHEYLYKHISNQPLPLPLLWARFRSSLACKKHLRL